VISDSSNYNFDKSFLDNSVDVANNFLGHHKW
jgi:hypothetical protein